MKKTPWFALPTKEGVYEVRTYDPKFRYSYWDGSCFNGAWLDADRALVESGYGQGLEILSWRGLATKDGK